MRPCAALLHRRLRGMILMSVRPNVSRRCRGKRRAFQTSSQWTPSNSPAEAGAANWREYDAAFRNQGSLTIWFTEEALAGWRAQARTTPGGQRQYSDLAIETGLTLRVVFRMAPRLAKAPHRH